MVVCPLSRIIRDYCCSFPLYFSFYRYGYLYRPVWILVPGTRYRQLEERSVVGSLAKGRGENRGLRRCRLLPDGLFLARRALRACLRRATDAQPRRERQAWHGEPLGLPGAATAPGSLKGSPLPRNSASNQQQPFVRSARVGATEAPCPPRLGEQHSPAG